jgi:hypothetical protein
MISHALVVMYQKMEEHARMWKSESKRPEVLLLDWGKHGWHITQIYKDKTVQCICKICTTIWVPNLARYM